VLAEGTPRSIEVGEVNGRVFLCASMLGLPARLGRHREAGRAGGWAIAGWIRYGRAVLRGLRRYAAPKLTLQAAGEDTSVRAVSITVTVNALDDPSGRLFGRGRLDGGELAVLVVDRLGLSATLRLVAALWRRRWREGGLVREFRATDLVVRRRSPAIRVMNDGEGLLLDAPLRYRIRPRALRVMAPARDAG
jgi:diacylglycerol kinase family enzyme